MPKAIVMYPPPTDVAVFERRYFEEHVPMAQAKLKGVKKFITALVLGSPQGKPPYHRVVELHFDSMEALQAAMGSEGGKETVAHAIEISTGGPMTVLIAEEDSPK